MEAVGVSFAVVSLPLQLFQTVETIRTYIRSYKQAPAEATRLADTLDIFGDVLKEVDEFIKNQNLHHASTQLVPTPSATLDRILKRCEAHLQRLQDLLDAYSQSHSTAQSARKRDKAKFIFKAKDISDLEERIHQEITAMGVALAVNSSRIQMSSLPMIIQIQQQVIAPPSTHPASGFAHSMPLYGGVTCPAHTQSLQSASHKTYLTVKTAQPTLNTKNTGIYYINRTDRLNTPLQWLGLQKRKTIRARREKCKDSTGKDFNREDIMCETLIYSWSLRFWQRGVEWSSSRVSGSPFSTLQTYPVIHDLWSEVYDLFRFETGSIDDFVSVIQSGRLHPYARDSSNSTLMSMAVYYARADLCKLLYGYGLRTISDDKGHLIAKLALHNPGTYYAPVDTARFLLEVPESNEVEIREDQFVFSDGSFNLELAEWLWDNALSLFADNQSAQTIRKNCLDSVSWYYSPRDWENFIQKIITSGDSSAQEFLTEPTFVYAIFRDSALVEEMDSFQLGEVLVNALLSLDVDLAGYRAYILKDSNDFGDFLVNCYLTRDKRQLLMETNSEGRWIIGWKYWFDPDESGYDLVSQFRALATHIYRSGEDGSWPYYYPDQGFEYHDSIYGGSIWYRGISILWKKRYQRKAEKKVQKRLRRSGQMSLGSQMPGSWIE